MRDEEETTIGVVGHFYRAPNGETRLFTLTVISEGYSRHNDKIYISRKVYDVEWSKKYGYLFHNSGSGGGNVVKVDGLFFCSGDVEIERDRCQLVDARDNPPWRSKRTIRIRRINATRRMMRLPRHVDLQPGQDLSTWLGWNGIEQDPVYCSECRDWVPGDELCKHCWWCDKRCWYSTPSDRCGHASREECDA